MDDIAQTPQDLATQIAALETEQAALFEQREPIDARLMKLHDLRQALVEKAAAFIDPTTDEGLEALWRAAWDNGRGNGAASAKLEAYVRSFAPEISGVEWCRKNHSGEVFPTLRLSLTRGQDVSALGQPLLELARKLAVGRETVYVSVFDHSLAVGGVYGIDIEVASGQAVLHIVRYGHRDDLLAGSLPLVLARTARDHWYEREAGAQDEDDEREGARGDAAGW
jgi:hypothetical protein